MSFGAIQAGRAYVGLYADDKGLIPGLAAGRARLMAWGKGLSGVGAQLSNLPGVSSLVGLMSSFSAAASGGPIAAAIFTAVAAFAALAGTLAVCTKLAHNQWQADMKLAAAVKATGGTAGHSAAELKKYADELEASTGIDNEKLQSGMAEMLKFQNIGPGVFKRGFAAAVDLAASGTMDLHAAVAAVGKALDFPVEGLTALQKAGVRLTEQQKNQVKALVQSGRLLEAQRMLVEALEGKFGGMAKDMADPIVQLKNSLAQIGKAIGFEILPYVHLLASGLNDALQGVSEEVGVLGSAFGVLADGFYGIFLVMRAGWVGITALVNATYVQVAALVGVMGDLGLVSQEVADRFKLAKEFSADNAAAAQKALKGTWEGGRFSERAAEWKRKFEARMNALGVGKPGGGPLAGMAAAMFTPPPAMLAGSAELAQAMARQGDQGEAQLIELQAIGNQIGDLRDQLNTIINQGEGEEEATVDLL